MKLRINLKNLASFRILFIFLGIFIFSCLLDSNSNESNPNYQINQEYVELKNILITATKNLNIQNRSLLYHYQNIFNYAFFILSYEPHILKEIDDILEEKLRYAYLLDKISTDSKSRLSILQFSYLLARIESYKVKSNLETNYKRIEYLNELVQQVWLSIPAWHWKKNFLNMKERTLAKINKDITIAGKNYYYAIIDEDIFLVGIVSELISSGNCYYSSLCKDILDTYFMYFKQKIDLNKDFSFSKGDWWDHPDYKYAGCETEEYPQVPCPKHSIEPDISHFHRFPWIIDSMSNAFYTMGDKEKANFLLKTLSKFYNKYNNRLLVLYKGFPLLKNFIDGSNGWYRIGYHPEYEKFGYGPYELSLIQVLGSYYYKNPDKNYILLMKRVLSEDSFKDLRNKYFDEKYPTTFTNALKIFGLYELRYYYYYLLAEISLRINNK